MSIICKNTQNLTCSTRRHTDIQRGKMHFWQNIQWLLPQTDIKHTIFIQYICTSHHNILKLRVLAHVTSNEIVYSKCNFFQSGSISLFAWVNGWHRCQESLRDSQAAKKWRKKCLQYSLFSDVLHLSQYWGNSIVSPTDLVPLGILQSTRKRRWRRIDWSTLQKRIYNHWRTMHCGLL